MCCNDNSENIFRVESGILHYSKFINNTDATKSWTTLRNYTLDDTEKLFSLGLYLIFNFPHLYLNIRIDWCFMWQNIHLYTLLCTHTRTHTHLMKHRQHGWPRTEKTAPIVILTREEESSQDLTLRGRMTCGN